MRVSLCGGNIRMTEHDLDGAEVRTSFDKVSGKRMTKGMRMHLFLQPRPLGIFFYDFPKALAGETVTGFVKKNNIRLFLF
jgi:hypothetical protein